MEHEGTKSLWKGLTPFATHLTLKYALRMGTNAFYQSLLRDQVGARCIKGHSDPAADLLSFNARMRRMVHIGVCTAQRR